MSDGDNNYSIHLKALTTPIINGIISVLIWERDRDKDRDDHPIVIGMGIGMAMGMESETMADRRWYDLCGK